MPKSRSKQKRKRKKRLARHALYEAAVQNVEADFDFVQRVFKKERKRRPRLLREDFCGSASFASYWVAQRPENRALGVDLDAEVLEWGRQHRVESLGEAAERVELIEADVREVCEPKVEVVSAFNFSYFTLRERQSLKEYFCRAYESLVPDGIFFLDVFGGSDALVEVTEKRRRPACRQPDGVKIPAFTYVWEQARFNPIDHHLICHIHFKLDNGTKMRRAFTYDWRFWTLPELRELLAEAGFADSWVYVEGWDEEEEEGDGIFRRRKTFDNEGSWIAYLVAPR